MLSIQELIVNNIISAAEELEAFRRTILKGFGIPETTADIFNKAYVDSAIQDPDNTFQHYLAYLDGEPISTLTTFIEGEVAGLYSVATLEAYRARGLARTLIAHVLGVVKQNGGKAAVIHANPMGRNVYTSVGFKDELTITVYS